MVDYFTQPIKFAGQNQGKSPQNQSNPTEFLLEEQIRAQIEVEKIKNDIKNYWDKDDENEVEKDRKDGGKNESE